MKLATTDVPRIIRFMEELAFDNGYSKLFAKVPGQAEGWFHANGFRVEARVPGMFSGEKDGCFMAKYPKQDRARIRDRKSVEDVLRTAEGQQVRKNAQVLPEGWRARKLGPDDAEAMAATFGAVFETYPFPIHDPGYLRSTMASDVRYFGIEDDTGRLVALSSAEMDPSGSNAEMTDFATLEAFRGKGLAGLLLALMEKDMYRAGIRTAYTIARAHATGMNIVFARQGYVFAGTLPNNTQIKGGLESMNVWFKHLAEHEKTI
jgi:putative beta-lysine N-acetyltransferase